MSKSTNATTTEAEARPSRLRMLWAVSRRLTNWVWTHPLPAGIVAGVILLPVVPIIVVQATLHFQFSSAVKPRGLQQALEALDRGDEVEASAIAHELGSDQPLPADELGGKPFVLGALADHRAARLLEQSRLRHQLLAVNYLKEARTLGFPPGRRGEGLYLLGKNLYRSGRIADSLPILQEALPLNPGRKAELHHYLAGAYLAENPPKLREAQLHNAQYLASRRLAPLDRQAGLLERARIELGLEEFDECRKTLAQIPGDSRLRPEAMLLEGQLLAEQARRLPQGSPEEPNEARIAGLKQAIETLAKAEDRYASAATLAAARFLTGRCRADLGDDQAALEDFARAAERFPETEAGVAGGFAAARILYEQARYELSLQRFRTALTAIDPSRPLTNRWTAPDELRAQALGTHHGFVRAKQFEAAIELARMLAPLFSAERALQLQAEATRLWGQELLSQAAAAGHSPTSAELDGEGREKLRRAGRCYVKLARMRPASREYPDDLYYAAECYLDGHDYQSAIGAFREYLSAESRRRRPRALIGLGEALLADDQPEQALSVLRECFESHVRDAAVFEARLLASQAELQQGNVKAAETLLLENLDGEALTPASQEWRDSLFALGRLFYHAGRYMEAIQRLEEAVARYPQQPAASEARYLIAESYRRRAQEIRDQADQEATAEGRLARNREAAQLLETSLEDFDLERDQLLARQEHGPLAPLEESILRNCFFARGAVLFELARYREAIEAYSSATNRYHRQPEVLQAYVQIAACYRRLGRHAEARSTLEQAKYALKHMPEGAVVGGATNYTREEWDRILNTLETL